MSNIYTCSVRMRNLLNFAGQGRYVVTNASRLYSVFPSAYVKPIFNKNEQEELLKTEEGTKLAHVPIKPAFTRETSSEFYDAAIQKFTNYIMREGNKILARNLMERTLENVKIMQLKRYNHSTPEEQRYIELDPKVVFYKAVANSTPVLELVTIRKGGIGYKVPTPLRSGRGQFLAMNWLIQASSDKDSSKRFHDVLAKELIDASNNEGRVVRRKQELHKQCEANRAYAHFRWS